MGAECRVRVEFSSDDSGAPPTVGFSIRDRLGNDVFGSNTHHLELKPSADRGGFMQVEFYTKLNIGPGSYSLSVSLHEGATHLEGNHDWWDRVLVFQVARGDEAVFSGVAQLPVKAAWVDPGTRKP